MSRLIDADKLIDGYKYDPAEHPEDSYGEGWCIGFNNAVSHCISHVIYAPTIEERKTGKWIPDNTNMYEMRFVCSSCKESQVVPTIFYKPIWGWCPNCGAKMEKQL